MRALLRDRGGAVLAHCEDTDPDTLSVDFGDEVGAAVRAWFDRRDWPGEADEFTVTVTLQRGA